MTQPTPFIRQIQAATKYGDPRKVQTSGPKTLMARRSANIFVPTLSGARQSLQEWYWRELKEGGFLNEYLKSEKRRTPAMVRRVARMMHGFQQNNKSSVRRIADIPARTYLRWKEEDPHFFEDNNNLRSLKRDNPDMPIYLGDRRLGGKRTVYPNGGGKR